MKKFIGYLMLTAIIFAILYIECEGDWAKMTCVVGIMLAIALLVYVAVKLITLD